MVYLVIVTTFQTKYLKNVENKMLVTTYVFLLTPGMMVTQLTKM